MKKLFLGLSVFAVATLMTINVSLACAEHDARLKDAQANTKIEKKFDANQDGKISRKERKELNLAIKEKSCGCGETEKSKGTCPMHGKKGPQAHHDDH